MFAIWSLTLHERGANDSPAAFPGHTGHRSDDGVAVDRLPGQASSPIIFREITGEHF